MERGTFNIESSLGMYMHDWVAKGLVFLDVPPKLTETVYNLLADMGVG